MTPIDLKRKIWSDFCDEYEVQQHGVPLFEESELVVNTILYGKENHKRTVLKRSSLMNHLIVSEAKKVIHDFNEKQGLYEGLIYMMFFIEKNTVIPLYIGKTEKYGKRSGQLSTNLTTNSHYFCRWGYNYAYHIGDLSAIVCPGHSNEKVNKKYEKWAESLFIDYPSHKPKLKRNTYFWCKAWKQGDIGPWKEFGPTPLTFLEYLLIGLSSSIFPELLNVEGVNRQGSSQGFTTY